LALKFCTTLLLGWQVWLDDTSTYPCTQAVQRVELGARQAAQGKEQAVQVGVEEELRKAPG
jgi:hypothetical protein